MTTLENVTNFIACLVRIVNILLSDVSFLDDTFQLLEKDLDDLTVSQGPLLVY